MVKLKLIETKEVKIRQIPNQDIWTECNSSDMHLATRTKYKLIFEGSSVIFYVWEEDLHKCKTSFEVDRLLWDAYGKAKGFADVQDIIKSLNENKTITVGGY
jgi:hypothetical protein